MNLDKVLITHPLYDSYQADWQLQRDAFHGISEFRKGKYLKAYTSDTVTPSETINTYDIQSDGAVVAKHRAKVETTNSAYVGRTGNDDLDEGSFYGEKLKNVPLYNLCKLVVSEYNAMLFRNPPQRVLPDTPEYHSMVNNIDGENNSINEFESELDQLVTIYGVAHVCVMKYNDRVRWRSYSPLDVINWDYAYRSDGSLELDEVVIQLSSCEEFTVYQYLTPEKIVNVMVGQDDDWQPEDDVMAKYDDGIYYAEYENELGYIPLVTIYQNTKVHNNIGSTVIGDCAQIQRSVYADLAEIYSAITYGAHPTLVVDESTDQLNNGEIGAEPGSIVRVPTSLTGDQSFTYEFVAPDLAAITEIRELIDNKLEKLAQMAMLRSEQMVKTSTSGEQIQQYDDKLSALIRRKATNMENAEQVCWQITADWLNETSESIVSYNRQFNKNALAQEVSELSSMIELAERIQAVTGESVIDPETALVLTQRFVELVNSTSTQNGV